MRRTCGYRQSGSLGKNNSIEFNLIQINLTSIGVNGQGEADEEDDGEVHHVASVVRRIAIRREDSWDLYTRSV